MRFLFYAFGDYSYEELNLPIIGIVDILDILIVAYLTYKIICWIKETRAWFLFKGIAVIFVFTAIAILLNLNTILWLLSNTISAGIIALIVVFQPELRRALEQLGKGNVFTGLVKFDAQKEDVAAVILTVDEIVKACGKMAADKTGALILVAQSVPLGDHERTGIPIDALVSSQLLINIFEHNTPLHDGAVVIKNNRIVAATCFLPLTDNNDISMDLGTRHRAAIGASEISDAFVVVVSEETGAISLSKDGHLHRNIGTEKLKNMLLSPYKIGKKKNLWKKGKGRKK